MAKTEVQITAVDKTQAAIRSATTSLKTIEKTAKVTGKAINLAFGLLTGGVLVSAFGKLTEAAKKTDEGRKALDELSKTLRDPALVEAANALSGALITGFTKALQKVSSFIQYTRNELVKLGAIEASGLAGQRALLEQEIAAASRASTGVVPGGGMDLSPLERARMIDAAKTLNQEEKNRIAYLRQALAIVNQQIEAERALAMAKEPDDPKKKKTTSSPRERAKKTKEDIDRWAMMTMEDIEPTFQEFGEGLADSLVAGLDARLRPQTGPLAEFAAEAARQMQGVFADFLFDPFEQGLKGMARGFVNILRRMLADLMARQLLLSFFNLFTGGTGMVANIANAAAQGLQARANGGPVTGNSPYLVGERGPELFVPSTGGSIVPNHKMSGTTVSPVYNIDAWGATMELAQALPDILADNNRRIFGERGPELFVPSTGGSIVPNHKMSGTTVSPVYNIDARGATMELAQALPDILADNNRRIFDELDRRYGIRA